MGCAGIGVDWIVGEIGIEVTVDRGMQRSENPGRRGVPLYARRGGLARWDAAQGELSLWRVTSHSHLAGGNQNSQPGCAA